MNLHEVVKKRRSIRNYLTDVDWEDIIEVIELAQNTPSAFNMQCVRVVLAKEKAHAKIWEIVLSKVIPVTDPKNLDATKEKIKKLSSGAGTLLIYIDNEVVEGLAKKFPLYATHFKQWAIEEVGMFQYLLWLGLTDKGYGASLQHYNPLIDDEIAIHFRLENDWKLVSQIPFGKPNESPQTKTLEPLDKILQIKID